MLHWNRQWYTLRVPTTRPRHAITESDVVAQAIDDAARRWPEDAANRTRLLLHLLEEGHRAILGSADGARRRRLEAVKASAGSLTGCYGPGYLEELRRDWPE